MTKSTVFPLYPHINPPKPPLSLQSFEINSPPPKPRYVLRINSAFHIDPLSSLDGDVSEIASEFWGADLAVRIWLWLSQIYGMNVPTYLGMSGIRQRLLGCTFLREAYSPFQLGLRRAITVKPVLARGAAARTLTPTQKTLGQETLDQNTMARPERHMRRMMARRARGIMPMTRYPGLYLRPLLPKGLTPTQFIEAVLRISSLGRLQSYNWNYHTHAFFRRGAIKARAALGYVRVQVGALCGALLSPD